MAHLVWVQVSHLLIMTQVMLLIGIGLRLISAVALVLLVLVFMCSSIE